MDDLDLLMTLARREVEGNSDAPVPALVALHGRPERAVFERAAALLGDGDVTRRTLGVRVLRELGDQGDDRRRPFSDETVPLLRARLRDETDREVLHWIILALESHGAREALREVLAFADHPDEQLRFDVAAVLPGLVDLSNVEPDAAEFLLRLCRDEDSDVRFYALYAATREVSGVDLTAMMSLTEELADDPDEQVKAMATEHRASIDVVRAMLGDSARDHLVGPILVSLACYASPGDLRGLLGESEPLEGLAEPLCSWWRAREELVPEGHGEAESA